MKVALGTLKDKGDDLVAFLEPRVGTKPSLSGGEIEIEDDEVKEGVRPRHVKTYIKRFLYMNGVRKKYRVFVAGKELTIQEIEVSEKEEEEKKAPEKIEEGAPAEEKSEEPEAPAEEPAKEEAAKEKPKKTATKKPRPKKKKAEEET
ncbi:MAG TPA: hypothetical protein VEJ19_03335 [Nitrososphaerales archaeon]|nr:hypothetical protein [Nitrososphaerales archaeon]